MKIDEYEINKEYEKKLRNKIESFRDYTATKKALHLTMITTYGVKNNMYSDKVQSQITLDDLFN